jgi:tRNA pseudouridine38-40 synthase
VIGAGRGSPLANGAAYGVLLRVAYDGTAFHGWAAQSGRRTVEEALRGAVLAMDPKASRLRGSSRTDAGVHAEGQLVAFDAAREIAPRGWVLGLNRHLPEDVAVRFASSVQAGTNPRFAARAKRYRYRLLVDSVRDPLWRTRAWRVDTLDLAALGAEAEAACGTHDFAGFRAASDRRDNTVRTLMRVVVEREPMARIIGVVVEGDAFLYKMVRNLVGTMVDVARGRLEPGAVERTLQTRSRRSAGTTAPAHGLVLEHVDLALPSSLEDTWPP